MPFTGRRGLHHRGFLHQRGNGDRKDPLGAVLPLLGMMVIPLFTVFITTKVKEYNKRISNREENLEAELRRDFP